MDNEESLELHPDIPERVEKLLNTSHNHIQKKRYAAALRAVERVPKKYQSYPQVLEQKWIALQEGGSYEEALNVASFLCLEYPQNMWGPLYKAESLAYLHRYDEAVEVLREGKLRFHQATFDLKTAAYRYAQGRHEEALDLLREIFATDTGGNMRRHAKEEPLLAAIKDEL